MNRPKNKILYLITQTELGGAQTYVYDLAHRLKNEFEITVAGGEQGAKGEIAKKIMAEDVKFFEIPHLIRAINPLKDLLALINIIKLIKKEKPDIIHLNSSKISILGSLAIFILRIKRHKSRVIYTAHGWIFNEPLPKFKILFYKYAEKLTARFKDKIICVSEFDRQAALDNKIAPVEKLTTIHNGLEKINFLPREEARKKLLNYSESETGNQKPKILIGSIGNLYPTKGYEYLIEAANILSYSRKIDLEMIIIGEGAQKNNLNDLIGQYGLKGKIILSGSLDGAAKYLKAFDIYVCSSVKEGLSYTIIEAMQAGLPIVATNVGGNGELIKTEKNGILVEPKNTEKIAEAIYRLTDDEYLKSNLSASAKEKADNEFTLEKMIRETKSIY